MSFSFYYVRRKKKTAITDKHCLQNVLILAVWDDVIPVFDHNPKAIFQIYLHYKTVWWKMHLLCSDYRLLQPNEQTFVLSTSPVWTTSSWLWSYLYFTTCYFSCQEVTLIKCEKSDLRGVTSTTRYDRGRRNLTAKSRVYEVNLAEDHVCISSPPSLFFFTHLSRHPPLHSAQSKQKCQKLDLWYDTQLCKWISQSCQSTSALSPEVYY